MPDHGLLARHYGPATLVAGFLSMAISISIAGAARAADPATERHCHLTVDLDPVTGGIDGGAVLALPDAERFRDPAGRLPIALDRRLVIDRASSNGVALPIERAGPDEDSGLATWNVALSGNALGAPISLHWSGALRDDVLAGEAPGRIHNLSVRAHIGLDGIYLAPEAGWHPVLDAPRSAGWTGSDAPLCLWTLDATSPFLLVASGDRSPRAIGTVEGAASATRWTTPFPQPSVAVAGGPLVAFERTHGPVLIRAMLREDSAARAPRLLEAVATYLDLYQPLLGAYPFREFTVVENFFSSGFALPGFTLLSSQVIEMGERGLRPGYLDHELLHNWWGNGVLASRASGHWAEALATYCANYMRPVLEGRREQARAQRRSVAETLSSSPTLAAQAVGDFGRDGSKVSNFVGYQKGAMVFDQLALRIGQDRVWAGLRRFYRDRLGKPSTWDDLRGAFEAESGVELATFFSFWVQGPGLPAPAIGGAVWDADGREVRIALTYRDPVTIDLPLRLRFADARKEAGAAEVGEPRIERVTIHPGDTSLRLASERRPIAIEVDPEFEIVRRLAPELLMPTLSGLAPPFDLVVVAAEHDLAGYAAASAAVEQRYGKTGQIERRRRFEPKLLDRGHVLVLGRAALDGELQRLFSSEGVVVRERGFEVAAVRYVNASDAVLACARNPRRAGAFVCLYRANADEALERSDLLPFYGGNSLLVFDRGQPVERRDFDAIERLEVR